MAAAVAACGSSAAGLSKPEYIARGDALCVAARRQLDALPPASTPTEIADYLNRSLQINGDMLAKLRALKPPPEDGAQIDGILRDFDAVLAQGRVTQQTAATGGDTATDVAVKELTMAVEKAGADARRYGFKSCGTAADSGSSPGP